MKLLAILVNKGSTEVAIESLRSLLVGIVFFCATTAGLPLVHRQIKADLAATRVEAENLARLLDAYKTRTGAYPDRLDDVKPSAERSRLLNRHDTYTRRSGGGTDAAPTITQTNSIVGSPRQVQLGVRFSF